MNLDGKKTYIAAAGGLLMAIGGFLTHSLTLPEAISLAFTSIQAAGIRSGVATAAPAK